MRSRFSASRTVWLVGFCRLGIPVVRYGAVLYGTVRYSTAVHFIEFLAPPLVMSSLYKAFLTSGFAYARRTREGLGPRKKCATPTRGTRWFRTYVPPKHRHLGMRSNPRPTGGVFSLSIYLYLSFYLFIYLSICLSV